MNGREIEQGLAGRLGNRIIFLGCHDESNIHNLFLHAKEQKKACVFCLLIEGPSKAEVGHWVTIYINYRGGCIGYYDTFNLHPALSSPTLSRIIQGLPRLKLITLEYRLQSMKTLVCGIYSLLFVWLMSNNNNLSQVNRVIHRTFKKNKYLDNDKLIVRIGYAKFDLPHCSKILCIGASKYMKGCMRRLCN